MSLLLLSIVNNLHSKLSNEPTHSQANLATYLSIYLPTYLPTYPYVSNQSLGRNHLVNQAKWQNQEVGQFFSPWPNMSWSAFSSTIFLRSITIIPPLFSPDLVGLSTGWGFSLCMHLKVIFNLSCIAPVQGHWHLLDSYPTFWTVDVVQLLSWCTLDCTLYSTYLQLFSAQRRSGHCSCSSKVVPPGEEGPSTHYSRRSRVYTSRIPIWPSRPDRWRLTKLQAPSVAADWRRDSILFGAFVPIVSTYILLSYLNPERSLCRVR